MADPADAFGSGPVRLERLLSDALDALQVSLATRRADTKLDAQATEPLARACQAIQLEARALLQSTGIAQVRVSRALADAGSDGAADEIAGRALAEAFEAWGRLRALVLDAGRAELSAGELLNGYGLLRTLMGEGDPLRSHALEAIGRAAELLSEDRFALASLCELIASDNGSRGNKELHSIAEVALYYIAQQEVLCWTGRTENPTFDITKQVLGRLLRYDGMDKASMFPYGVDHRLPLFYHRTLGGPLENLLADAGLVSY